MALAVGILLQARLQMASPGWIPIVSGAVAVAVFLRRRLRAATALLLLGVAALGALRWPPDGTHPSGLADRAWFLREARGIVASYPDLGRTHTVFDVILGGGPERVRVTVFPDVVSLGWIHIGDEIAFRGRFERPTPLAGFDYAAYLARRGIRMTVTVASPEDLRIIEPSATRALAGAGDRLRQRLMAALHRLLPEDAAGLAAALLFGARDLLRGDVERAFETTGLMHLLATSGLHLAIVLSGLWMLLRGLGVRPALSYPLVALAAAGCLWLVGPRMSLMRAVTMLAFIGLGHALADVGLILHRWVDPLHALAASAFCILLAAPGSLLDAGFQLSYAATAAILLGVRARPSDVPCVQRGGGRLRARAFMMLRVSLAAHLGTAPLVAMHFGSYHPLAIPANLLAIPTVTAALWLDVLLAALAATPVAGLIAVPLRWILAGLQGGLQRIAALPGAALPAGAWIGWWLAGLGALLLGVQWVISHREPERGHR
jgi:competence protein ComEC